jgi:hypothetical protein
MKAWCVSCTPVCTVPVILWVVCILYTSRYCTCHPVGGVYPVHKSVLYLPSCGWCVSCTSVCTVPVILCLVCILYTSRYCTCHPVGGVYSVHQSVLYLSSCGWCVFCTPVSTVPVILWVVCILYTRRYCTCHPVGGVYPVHHPPREVAREYCSRHKMKRDKNYVSLKKLYFLWSVFSMFLSP